MNKNKFLKIYRNATASLILLTLPFHFYTTTALDTTGDSEGYGSSTSQTITSIPPSTTPSIPIRGYVLEEKPEYDVRIYWDDMVFVFDKGDANQKSALPATTQTRGEITTDMVELDSTPGTIGRWYGFDGSKNKITVLNGSNADVYVKYSAITSAELTAYENSTKPRGLTLYDSNSNNEDAVPFTMTALENTPEGSRAEWTLDSAVDVNTRSLVEDEENDDADADEHGRFGNEQRLSGQKKLKAFPKNGTVYGNKIFFSISGTPNDEFARSEDEAITAGSIGTITITLSKNPFEDDSQTGDSNHNTND